MRNSLIVLGIVILMGGGYYAYTQMQSTTTETPTDTASQGKLDINVICEESLAYTTFEEGVSTEQYLRECKEGKHPQVIEEYKKRMNLGDGAAY